MVDSFAHIIQELADGAQALSTAAAELATTSSQQSACDLRASDINQANLLQTLEDYYDTIRPTSAAKNARLVVEISDGDLLIGCLKAGQEALTESVSASIKIKDQVQEIC